MTVWRDFEPEDPLPAHFLDALQEYLQGSAWGFQVRIKPGAPTVLQVPASAGDGRAAIAIESRWRYAEANVEAAGSGAARTVDVWVTSSANAYHFDAGPPLHEVDDTVYAFALAIAEVGVPPVSAIKRQVATAIWNGTRFTGVLPLVGAGSVPSQPVGSFVAYGGATAPPGWLVCDGSPVSRTGGTAALFDAIGTTFGAGDGSTTFNLPDLRGRVPVGVDGAAGRLDASDALGNSGGAQKHTMTIAEMPYHLHGMQGVPGSSSNTWQGWNMGDAGDGFTMPYTSGAISEVLNVNGEGGGGAHNNMPPFQVVNWLVKT